MAKDESPREAALRRVAEQGARVARQKKAVATLKANGAGTYAAEQLLVTMEDTLASLRATLIRYPK
jgi:hypothetical protein